MVLVDARAYSEHNQVIRCDIKPESADKSKDVENMQTQKKSRVYLQRHVFKHRNTFWNLRQRYREYIIVNIDLVYLKLYE